MTARYTIRLAHLELVALLLCVAAVAATLAPPAEANVGYKLDSAHPSAPLTGLFARGLAVDQSNGDIYVAIASTNLAAGARGEILRFNSDLSADGTFASGGGFYAGVAPNSLSGGFFAAQMELRTVFGNFGTSKLDRFDSSGSLLGSFPISFSDSLPPIAADSAGHIYIPNVTTHSVQIYSSAGTLLEEVTCSGCPGGSFGKPGSVAVDASGSLYVADTNPDRVVKLTPSGGSYAFGSLVQSGRGAGAVAVDPGSGDILVGDMPGGNNFHVVAYDSSGVQFDDFGAGMFPDVSEGGYGVLSTYQMAVNGGTHKLYVGSADKFYAFEKTTIPVPSATIEPATSTGQQGSTLNATVNANGHAVLQCEFEYTNEGNFLANGFSAASHVPCSQNPDGTGDAALTGHASGLSPGSAYRYRITVTSNGGTVSSDDEAFSALPELPPLVTTEAAQSVTQTTAKIKASVNPRGGTVSVCRFELGTSVAYGTNLSCLIPPNGASTAVSETRSLTALLPATTYHYRLVVTTNAGTAEGDDVEFTTASPPSEPEPGGGSSPEPGPTPAPGAGTLPPPTAPVVTPPPAQCKKGFRRMRVNGQSRCVKVCPKGFRTKISRGKVRCVRKKHATRRRADG
jgi:hypothetical protein